MLWMNHEEDKITSGCEFIFLGREIWAGNDRTSKRNQVPIFRFGIIID